VPQLKKGDLVELISDQLPKKFKYKAARIYENLSVGDREIYAVECDGETLTLSRKDFNFVAPAKYDKGK